MGTQSVTSGSVTFSPTGISGIHGALRDDDVVSATEKIAETVSRSAEVASQLSDLYTIANEVQKVLQIGLKVNKSQTLGEFVASYVEDIKTQEVTRNSVELLINKIIDEGGVAVDPETKKILVGALSEYLGEHITQGASLIDLRDLLDPTGVFVKIVIVIGVTILANKLKTCKEINHSYQIDEKIGRLRNIKDREKIDSFCESFPKQFTNDIFPKLDYRGEFSQRERKRIERKIRKYMQNELKNKSVYSGLKSKPRKEPQLIAVRLKEDKKYRLRRSSKYKPRTLIHLPNSELDFKWESKEARLDNISALDDNLGELTQEEEDFLNLIRLLFASEMISDTRDVVTLTFSTPIKKYWENKIPNIEKIFEFLTERPVRIELVRRGKTKKVELKKIKKVDEICLISGGIDSLAGAIKLIKEGKNIAGVYVSSAGHVKKSVDAVDKYLRQIGDSKYRLYFGSNGLKKIPKKGDNIRQTRAFVYLSIALLYARRSGAKKIAVPESGPTMINIPITDSVKPTKTVHPDFLESLKLLFNSLFDDFKLDDVYSPLEEMTKPDEMNEIIKDGAEKVIPSTTSCFNMRTSGSCGKCYGCVTRRLSCIVAGTRDRTYKFDIFTENKSIIKKNPDNFEIPLGLIELASNVLNWNDLEVKHKLTIKNSGKEKLLKRFYAQILYAIYLKWKENKKSKSPVLQRFGELVQQKKIKPSELKALI